MNTLKPSEEKTLQAFLVALTQLDRPLSPDLQQTLHQLGNDLAAQHSDAIAQLPAIASQDPALNSLYETARLDLQKRYQSQERAKGAVLPIDSPGFKLNLENLASQIFRETDSVGAAQTFLNIQTLPTKTFQWEKVDRILIMAAGGAFIGGLIAQIPGAIIGSLVAALYGFYIGFAKPRQQTPDRNA